mmetsp:Transcript_11500/g.32551  ORF Transcript_11500/g.32551 Transcript_11500/m.32551 type:complete len:225 (-) Transcript_11500:956-1630(-)
MVVTEPRETRRLMQPACCAPAASPAAFAKLVWLLASAMTVTSGGSAGALCMNSCTAPVMLAGLPKKKSDSTDVSRAFSPSAAKLGGKPPAHCREVVDCGVPSFDRGGVAAASRRLEREASGEGGVCAAPSGNSGCSRNVCLLSVNGDDDMRLTTVNTRGVPGVLDLPGGITKGVGAAGIARRAFSATPNLKPSLLASSHREPPRIARTCSSSVSSSCVTASRWS